MIADSGRRRRATGLTDRRAECGALDRLVDAVGAGESRALVVRGDPGAGKTALLEYLAGRASDSRYQVVRVVGVQSEMELAFAGLHQLCAPMLSRAGQLPVPQRDALLTALGVAAGPPPDRFLLGLAVLGLLSEVAGDRALMCLVDDVHWLDRASAQVLGFTARRLAADPVGLVFAAREPGEELAGLAELEVGGLRDDAARTLLESALAGPLDARVRDLIIAETRGNPLALLELPRGLTPAELAGGFGLPGATPLTGRIEDSFARQLEALPAETRRLVLLAAADPSGDRALIWRAAGRLGIPIQAAGPAAEAGLVEFGARVRFRHPLARSAAYRLAPIQARQEMHAALAEVTDPAADPDRRAWHRAQAAPGPDEEVAAELERSAERAQARGGLAAAAAFLERAVMLTADPARRAERALAAAQAHMHAGGFGNALDLLATAEAGVLDEFASARVDLLRGQIAFASSRGSDAPPLLLKAAKRLEPLNRDLARDTYLTAWMAATYAGHLAGAGDMLEVCRAAQALPPPEQASGPLDLLLEGLALLVTEGPAAAAPALRQAVSAFASADIPMSDRLQFGPMAQGAAIALWNEEGQRAILIRQVELARAVGALDQLPVDLVALAIDDAWRGDFAGASSLIAECDAVCAATGREQRRALRRHVPRRAARPRGGDYPADSGHPRRGRSRRTGRRGDRGALGGRSLAQWPRPLRRRADGGRKGHPRTLPCSPPSWWCPSWSRPPPAQVTPMWRPARSSGWQRRRSPAAPTRPRRRSALPGAAERRRDRRAPVPRGDRPARPYPAPPGSGPRPPAVRRVAAPPGPTRRRAAATADRL